MWRLAGEGWRLHFIDYGQRKIAGINTPSHGNLRKAYSSLIGLENFSEKWAAFRWTEEDYIEKIENLLALRHRIAHGTIGDETVGKTKARDAVRLVERLALNYAELGRTDEAFDALFEAIEAQEPRCLTLKVEPTLEPLRSDPRWGELLRRLGF